MLGGMVGLVASAAESRSARYQLEGVVAPVGNVVVEFWYSLGEQGPSPGSAPSDEAARWVRLAATKQNGERYRVSARIRGEMAVPIVTARKQCERFLLESTDREPVEFQDAATGGAVLPSLGGWTDLWPRSEGAEANRVSPSEFPSRVRYLGHVYLRAEERAENDSLEPGSARVVRLRPDLWIGVPSNQKPKDDRRRYDGSDYEMQRLTEADYREMAEAGINCVRVDVVQRRWVEALPMFYWGVGGNDVPYPESLYDSRYLGPALFLDEPAVHTRDFVIRPQMAKDLGYRVAINPRLALEAFRKTFQHAWEEGAANELLKGLRARPDVDLGTMRFRQANLYSWETMISTAAHQLSQDPDVPSAMVFEPPGRLGTWRTLPEMNMTYGCQIPVDDPKNLASILYGFLRGAARLTGKEWGTSIYGAVDRADAPWFLTHAYDLGATRFFFWDNYQLACVPRAEYLALSRQLRMRTENRPQRDLGRLRDAAEVVILLPAGYNLGHVSMGKGNLWGLGELNLERLNERGVKYRDVMGQFFLEIERCLRLGVAFDLLWDLPEHPPRGYREVVRIREDGKVEVTSAGRSRPEVLSRARLPMRPEGSSPKLTVKLSTTSGKAPLEITAQASVEETSAAVYYTYGADPAGVSHNAAVSWELYGPNEEDQRVIAPAGLRPKVRHAGATHEVEVGFGLEKPGNYRLRVATVDVAGRATVTWVPISVSEK